MLNTNYRMRERFWEENACHLLILIALIGMATADSEEEEQSEQNGSAYDNPTAWEEKKLNFNFEQNASGTVFFNALNMLICLMFSGLREGFSTAIFDKSPAISSEINRKPGR